MLLETAIIDPVDSRIIRCLQLAPRIPFRVVAQIVGVSEQTAARRYRRLVRDGVLRVTAVVNPAALGQSNWLVRARCRPSGALALARALGQRDDVSWVTLMAGGSEVMCVLRARTSEARDDLLLEKLPRTAPVLGIDAAMVLHSFLGAGQASADDWSSLREALTDDQQAEALKWAEPPVADRVPRMTFSGEDSALLDALGRDGRATFAALGAETGIGEARAAARLRSLLNSGAVYLDVDVPEAALGFTSAATLWLTVAPADLDRVGRALSLESEVAYAAAITGRQNIMASAVCVDVADLYEFVTTRVGSIPGIQAIEISPVLRHLKQAGALTAGNRLVPPDR